MKDFDNTNDGNLTWAFSCEDKDEGTTNIVEFKAETWIAALEKFICFLHGAGYIVPEDAVAINARYANGHNWMGEVFDSEAEALIPKHKVD